ncbi:hypothetical protein OV090_09170 [Nannocystis sp. RBIL2]|uniref:hypothetical protein n=1 Tax=Nannocystis sp. RBIL2 TaxID=2996788 RepID=UPI002271A82D|nr:hypothetical protein [Nannocystis sp. RBIL2]MCY1064929.1 hypothetical protein [Nannocystis sp. RBIL2]
MKFKGESPAAPDDALGRWPSASTGDGPNCARMQGRIDADVLEAEAHEASGDAGRETRPSRA